MCEDITRSEDLPKSNQDYIFLFINEIKALVIESRTPQPTTGISKTQPFLIISKPEKHAL